MVLLQKLKTRKSLVNKPAEKSNILLLSNYNEDLLKEAARRFVTVNPKMQVLLQFRSIPSTDSAAGFTKNIMPTFSLIYHIVHSNQILDERKVRSSFCHLFLYQTQEGKV